MVNFKWIVVCVQKKVCRSRFIHKAITYLDILYNIWFWFQVALRRQQTSQDAKSSTMDGTKAHAVETLLAQKRDYHKHLRNLQQSSMAKNILQGTCQFSSQIKVSQPLDWVVIIHHYLICRKVGTNGRMADSDSSFARIFHLRICENSKIQQEVQINSYRFVHSGVLTHLCVHLVIIVATAIVVSLIHIVQIERICVVHLKFTNSSDSI